MQRISITLDDALDAAFDAFLVRHGYDNRSEAIRDLIRERLRQEMLEQDNDTEQECLAHLTYVFNHEVRTLARRLTAAQHAQHALTVATLHVHLDAEHCLETVILRGPKHEVRELAAALVTQPGVFHGHLELVPLVPAPSDSAQELGKADHRVSAFSSRGRKSAG